MRFLKKSAQKSNGSALFFIVGEGCVCEAHACVPTKLKEIVVHYKMPPCLPLL